ncbi:MAG: polysaccharide deacetylase family protein [Bacilli bacterium]|nr:polysaccharide deacetylase family protein [Bacilli bacterium]
MKYFIFSIDDGTIFDEKVLQILNRFGFKGTFNLNSGMDDFVWYNEGREVRRFILKDHIDLYKNHDIASHSFYHPHMTSLDDQGVYEQVNNDIHNLKEIFHREVNTFAFPFEDYDERCINIIKNIEGIKLIRLSALDRSFKMPNDPYHVKITSWNIDEALYLIDEFIKNKEAELFIFVSHAYDFEFANAYEKLEALCQKIKSVENIEVITMSDLIKLL